MKYLKRFDEANSTDLKNQFMDLSSISDSVISNLVRRRLEGESLSEDEFLRLHNWMFHNDEEYRKTAEREMKKNLAKLVPRVRKKKD